MSFVGGLVRTILPAISLGLTVAQTVAGFRAARQQEKVGALNAQIALNQARRAAEAKLEQARELQDLNRRRLAASKVSVLKAGVELAGSPVLVLGDIAAKQAEDVATLLEEARTDIAFGADAARLAKFQAAESAFATRIDTLTGLGSGLISMSHRLPKKKGKKASFFPDSTFLG